MGEPVFLIALGIVAFTVLTVAKTVAGAIAGRRTSGEFGHLKEQLDQQAAAIEEAESTLASQSAQIAELQERLDFTERLLAQRDRSALGPGQ
ncbi:MAG TPA: hypothetical protein VJ817_10425 [Gemmatimonadales bacterium]|nr:hypothetical protein [Gemmatimonadales bacterium]